METAEESAAEADAEAVSEGGAEAADEAWELPGGSAEAAYGQFVDEHAGVWFKEFADSLATTAEHPFYRAVAMYLAAIS